MKTCAVVELHRRRGRLPSPGPLGNVPWRGVICQGFSTTPVSPTPVSTNSHAGDRLSGRPATTSATRPIATSVTRAATTSDVAGTRERRRRALSPLGADMGPATCTTRGHRRLPHRGTTRRLSRKPEATADPRFTLSVLHSTAARRGITPGQHARRQTSNSAPSHESEVGHVPFATTPLVDHPPPEPHSHSLARTHKAVPWSWVGRSDTRPWPGNSPGLHHTRLPSEPNPCSDPSTGASFTATSQSQHVLRPPLCLINH